MANIIKFPRSKNTTAAFTSAPAPVLLPTKPAKGQKIGFFSWVMRFVWITITLAWPILKWVLSLEVAYQFFRMVYQWETPGVHAGWTFLWHFSALTALTYFVAFYKPKGM